ncbi:MAG: hypothetical protein P8Z42_04010 [Anaerolineales bacterium]|jgi:hypothetical protein
MYADNELLYPPYVTPRLRSARGEPWRDLVDRISRLPQDDPENLAFQLMMIRLNGCLKCETDSYRAMRGCLACTHQTLRRHKPPDEDLIDCYNAALEDMIAHLEMESGKRIAPAAKAA